MSPAITLRDSHSRTNRYARPLTFVIAVALVTLFFQLTGEAFSQSYPTKPVRLLVPSTAGGEPDVVARALASSLTETLGQPIVVDNKAGAAGTIAANIVARSDPDGYTLQLVTARYAATALFVKLQYDPLNDIQPISQIARGPFLIATHPSIPVNDVRSLIALAKSKPGAITYGSAYATATLAGEIFKFEANVDIKHVPYKGTSTSLTSVIRGEVQLTFGSMLPTLREARAGRLRAIAVTSRVRSHIAPEIPTVAESGIPSYEVAMWYGVIGPKGMPAPIVDRLHSAIVHTLNKPEVQNVYRERALEPVGSTSDEMAALLASESAKWGRVVKANDILCPFWPFC